MTRGPRAALLYGLMLASAAGCQRGQSAAPRQDRSAGPEGGSAGQNSHDGGPAIQLTAEGMANAQVEVVRITATTFAPRLRVGATIIGDPRKIAQVGARLPGRVAGIRVKLGDSVRKGQPLVEVDGLEVHEVTLDYLSAAARLRAAEDHLARQRELVEARVGAVADLRKAESEQAAAKASVDQAGDHLAFLGFSTTDVRKLGRGSGHGEQRAVVRAPIAGRVASLEVTLGQVVTGNEPIVTITQLDQVAAALRVYERDVAHVRVGSTVEVDVQAYPGRTFRGQIDFVGDILEPVTRTLQARVNLQNTDGALKPGMTAQASITLPAGPRELWIPAEAVQPYQRGTIVFVAVSERRFRPQPVLVGDERGGFVPIAAGITPGTALVVRGALTLRGELERGALEAE